MEKEHYGTAVVADEELAVGNTDSERELRKVAALLEAKIAFVIQRMRVLGATFSTDDPKEVESEKSDG